MMDFHEIRCGFSLRKVVPLAWVAWEAMQWKSYFTDGCKLMSSANLKISWASWINFFTEGLEIISVIIKCLKIATAKAVLYLSGLYEISPVHSALLALNWMKFGTEHVHKNLLCKCEFLFQYRPIESYNSLRSVHESLLVFYTLTVLFGWISVQGIWK